MAAYEIPNLRFSGEAGDNIARRRFVKVNNLNKLVKVKLLLAFLLNQLIWEKS